MRVYRAGMGIFDKFKKQATAAVDQHGDKIAQGLDKAADVADKKTGGKHSSQINTGVDKTKDALYKLVGKDDDIPNGPAGRP